MPVDVLEPYVKEIADLKKDLPKILRDILIKRKDDVLKILKEDQLGKGLNSSGNVIGTYSQATEIISIENQLLGNKPRKPKVAGEPFNFEYTGSLFDKMSINFEDFESYSIFSKDSKADFLEKEYGDIYTLTTKHNERVNQEVLRPEMYDVIVQRVFG